MAGLVQLFELLVHPVAHLDALDLADLGEPVAAQDEAAAPWRFGRFCHDDIVPQ